MPEIILKILKNIALYNLLIGVNSIKSFSEKHITTAEYAEFNSFFYQNYNIDSTTIADEINLIKMDSFNALSLSFNSLDQDYLLDTKNFNKEHHISSSYIYRQRKNKLLIKSYLLSISGLKYECNIYEQEPYTNIKIKPIIIPQLDTNTNLLKVSNEVSKWDGVIVQIDDNSTMTTEVITIDDYYRELDKKYEYWNKEHFTSKLYTTTNDRSGLYPFQNKDDIGAEFIDSQKISYLLIIPDTIINYYSKENLINNKITVEGHNYINNNNGLNIINCLKIHVPGTF